jgi:hypothetical protein
LYLEAADEADLPSDHAFREALRSHLEFGSKVAQQNSWAGTDSELNNMVCRRRAAWVFPRTWYGATLDLPTSAYAARRTLVLLSAWLSIQNVADYWAGIMSWPTCQASPGTGDSKRAGSGSRSL